MSLNGKNIVIGVCGSIAAYKIASLVRLLTKEHAQVQVIMTPDAQSFITPLTLATLSKNPVLSAYFDPASGAWHNHVELGLQADLLLIAPATANSIAKMANGMCDNLLLATYLSARCPVMFAPAMDLDMWKHPSSQLNIQRLLDYGNILIEPTSGELASGLIGQGRMAEPADILLKIQSFFATDQPLKGKKALVSAGPTYEAIDPVRFIGNHSSGKMGYAIAERLQQLGASVVLVSGPTALESPQNVSKVLVTSAKEMLNACTANFEESDIVVMSAAVADYTPKAVATQKIKKKESTFQIELEKTVDILASLGKEKTAKQTLVGFALETNNELENAIDKLKRKNLDFIVLNSMQDKGAGFSHDTNKVTIINKNTEVQEFTLKSKAEVAIDLCQLILAHQQSINS